MPDTAIPNLKSNACPSHRVIAQVLQGLSLQPGLLSFVHSVKKPFSFSFDFQLTVILRPRIRWNGTSKQLHFLRSFNWQNDPHVGDLTYLKVYLFQYSYPPLIILLSMVRIKHRYLLVNILYPEPLKSHPHQPLDIPDLVSIHQPTSDELTPQLLAKAVRDQILLMYGDYGAGVTSTGLLGP